MSTTMPQHADTQQAEANRPNAGRSTGPRTEAGKAASSRNAVRHGLTGIFCVLPCESHDEYLALLGELYAEHNPATATEQLLVSDMARHYWLVQRAMRMQELVMLRDFNENLVQKQLALFMRYQTTNQRAFHKCLADLQKLQKQRKKEEEEFVSQVRKLERAAPPKATATQAATAGSNGFVSQNTTFKDSHSPLQRAGLEA